MPEQNDPSVFSSEPVVPASPTPPPAPSPTATYDTLLDSIRNEQGQRKYANVEAALKGLENAQGFIPTLQGELASERQRIAALEAELSKRESVEEVVARLTAAKQDNTGNTTPTGLDQQTVEQLIQQQLIQRDSQLLASSNEKVVNDALIAKYGKDKALEVVKAKADELGISVSDLGVLSRKSPKAVLAYFDAKPTQAQSTPSSINSSGFQAGEKPTVVARPEKSVLAGASRQEVESHFQDIKRAVHARLGVEE